MRFRGFARWLLGSVVSAVLGACAEPEAVEPPRVPPRLPSDESPPIRRGVPPPPLSVPGDLDDVVALETNRWLHVQGLRDGVEGGWADGWFVKEANKIVIDTEGVSRFAVDLDRIDIDWTRRVVLRIDGANSELTRRSFPTLRLQRTSAGSWSPAKE